MKLNIGTMVTAVLMNVAGKLIAALGVGFISYAGLNLMQNKLAAYLQTQLGGIPADALNIFYIAGGGVVLNWLFGAFAFIATIKASGKLVAGMRK